MRKELWVIVSLFYKEKQINIWWLCSASRNIKYCVTDTIFKMTCKRQRKGYVV